MDEPRTERRTVDLDRPPLRPELQLDTKPTVATSLTNRLREKAPAALDGTSPPSLSYHEGGHHVWSPQPSSSNLVSPQIPPPMFRDGTFAYVDDAMTPLAAGQSTTTPLTAFAATAHPTPVGHSQQPTTHSTTQYPDAVLRLSSLSVTHADGTSTRPTTAAPMYASARGLIAEFDEEVSYGGGHPAGGQDEDYDDDDDSWIRRQATEPTPGPHLIPTSILHRVSGQETNVYGSGDQRIPLAQDAFQTPTTPSPQRPLFPLSTDEDTFRPATRLYTAEHTVSGLCTPVQPGTPTRQQHTPDKADLSSPTARFPSDFPSTSASSPPPPTPMKARGSGGGLSRMTTPQPYGACFTSTTPSRAASMPLLNRQASPGAGCGGLSPQNHLTVNVNPFSQIQGQIQELHITPTPVSKPTGVCDCSIDDDAENIGDEELMSPLMNDAALSAAARSSSPGGGLLSHTRVAVRSQASRTSSSSAMQHQTSAMLMCPPIHSPTSGGSGMAQFPSMLSYVGSAERTPRTSTRLGHSRAVSMDMGSFSHQGGGLTVPALEHSPSLVGAGVPFARAPPKLTTMHPLLGSPDTLEATMEGPRGPLEGQSGNSNAARTYHHNYATHTAGSLHQPSFMSSPPFAPRDEDPQSSCAPPLGSPTTDPPEYYDVMQRLDFQSEDSDNDHAQQRSATRKIHQSANGSRECSSSLPAALRSDVEDLSLHSSTRRPYERSTLLDTSDEMSPVSPCPPSQVFPHANNELLTFPPRATESHVLYENFTTQPRFPLPVSAAVDQFSPRFSHQLSSRSSANQLRSTSSTTVNDDCMTVGCGTSVGGLHDEDDDDDRLDEEQQQHQRRYSDVSPPRYYAERRLSGDEGGAMPTEPPFLLADRYDDDDEKKRFMFAHEDPRHNDGSKCLVPLHIDVNGVVWLATRTIDGQHYAVKEVPLVTVSVGEVGDESTALASPHAQYLDVELECLTISTAHATALDGIRAADHIVRYHSSFEFPSRASSFLRGQRGDTAPSIPPQVMTLQLEYFPRGNVAEVYAAHWQGPLIVLHNTLRERWQREHRPKAVQQRNTAVSLGLSPRVSVHHGWPIKYEKEAQHTLSWLVREVLPSPLELLTMLQHTVLALSCLHHRGIVHGCPTLWSLHIVTNYHYKLSNFGAARRVPPAALLSMAGPGWVDQLFGSCPTELLPAPEKLSRMTPQQVDLHVVAASVLRFIYVAMNKVAKCFSAIFSNASGPPTVEQLQRAALSSQETLKSPLCSSGLTLNATHLLTAADTAHLHPYRTVRPPGQQQPSLDDDEDEVSISQRIVAVLNIMLEGSTSSTDELLGPVYLDCPSPLAFQAQNAYDRDLMALQARIRALEEKKAMLQRKEKRDAAVERRSQSPSRRSATTTRVLDGVNEDSPPPSSSAFEERNDSILSDDIVGPPCAKGQRIDPAAVRSPTALQPTASPDNNAISLHRRPPLTTSNASSLQVSPVARPSSSSSVPMSSLSLPGAATSLASRPPPTTPKTITSGFSSGASTPRSSTTTGNNSFTGASLFGNFASATTLGSSGHNYGFSQQLRSSGAVPQIHSARSFGKIATSHATVPPSAQLVYDITQPATHSSASGPLSAASSFNSSAGGSGATSSIDLKGPSLFRTEPRGVEGFQALRVSQHSNSGGTAGLAAAAQDCSSSTLSQRSSTQRAVVGVHRTNDHFTASGDEAAAASPRYRHHLDPAASHIGLSDPDAARVIGVTTPPLASRPFVRRATAAPPPSAEDQVVLAPYPLCDHFRPVRLMSSLTVNAVLSFISNTMHLEAYSSFGTTEECSGAVYRRKSVFPGVQQRQPPSPGHNQRAVWAIAAPKTMNVMKNFDFASA
ncbi:Hypothetical protein, putative [Bodo saltans]|uniref:Protein kinase domain-containing protein n=1 Tax=Bodo saltans TaxID=75058 RepID=A0A0S4JLA7_BODSA|nr:Hypothetical protein, putative [Bodo saltans]|eukprot:CUG90966.1 Hypothetical protein, putative [Bodo saltans]